MNEHIAIQDIQPIIKGTVQIPTVLMWNRLEGRPRTKNFDRALRAEVSDALFMLTKQWQMGEFRGDDAGSPVTAKVHIETTRLNKYHANGHETQGFEKQVPIEAKVEQRMLPFKAGGQDLSLDIRLLMGRHWLKMISKLNINLLKEDFIKAYGINMPDPGKREDAPICAHQVAWQQYAAVAAKAMDGAGLYFYLKDDPNNKAHDNLTIPLTAGQEGLIDDAGKQFTAWFEKLFYQPIKEEDDAWLPSRLEYQFACSAPKKGAEQVFTAEEYYHGHLDWYNMNVNTSIETLGNVAAEEREASDPEGTYTSSFFPTQIQFDGMPNTRWWTFEEGKTNFGDIKPDTTDLDKLLLIEFGLVYANDWFMIPFTLPAGSVANVRGMSVTNVFGERTWIRPAGQGTDEDWQRWNMYTLNISGDEDEKADLSLLILPTVPKIQESQPVEEIYLIRDEMANMAWGIESKIILPGGSTKPGREAAIELKNCYQRILDEEKAAAAGTEAQVKYKADIRYQIMNAVPENWIPFIPVHVKNNYREMQLQRAAMPRILEGDTETPERIRPRTKLLRCGLEQTPKTAYKLFEEEVPRVGIRVYQSYQRTRWYGGRIYNWLGIRKQTGRGEGSSGLRFDQIVPGEVESS